MAFSRTIESADSYSKSAWCAKIRKNSANGMGFEKKRDSLGRFASLNTRSCPIIVFDDMKSGYLLPL